MTGAPTIRGPLTAEIKNTRSPVRRFLDEHFTAGLRDVQRRYRQASPSLVVPGNDANPSTVGTAADWLLRFLIHPQPDLDLAVRGAALCARAHTDMGASLAELGDALSVPLPRRLGQQARTFAGPTRASHADHVLLAQGCWALALLTEVYRGGPVVLANGPLGQLRHSKVSGDDLLGLAPQAALDQLVRLGEVFETALIPHLAEHRGPWVLGPTFAGSELIAADADLIAAGLLLELKTSSKFTLPGADMLQLIGYVLLDFDDEYQLHQVGIFSARYAHLATWDLHALLDELAGHKVDLQAVRADFQQLLRTH